MSLKSQATERFSLSALSVESLSHSTSTDAKSPVEKKRGVVVWWASHKGDVVWWRGGVDGAKRESKIRRLPLPARHRAILVLLSPALRAAFVSHWCRSHASCGFEACGLAHPAGATV